MRPMTIVGAFLIAAGLFVVIYGASYTKDKTLLKVAPLEANVKEQQSIPPWAGAAAIIVGIGCVVVGVRKA
jgi:drug/metabolite transporter (DMT)-like permease